MDDSRVIEFDAIGTHWTIDLVLGQCSDMRTVEDTVKRRIDEFDMVYSRFRDDSLVSKIAKEAGEYTFPEDAEPLFAWYKQLYDATDGKVTPLVGNLLSDAGYDASYSLLPAEKLTPTEKWEDAMTYKHRRLTVRTPVLLDFGAAGKGYLVDIIGELLEEQGIIAYCIDAGGDILKKSVGNDAIRVGLEHPSDATQAIGVVELSNGSICGSAGNRRTWAGLHHIMDPQTTKPVRTIIATWVVAANSLTADGLATALFFVDPKKLQTLCTFEYCIVRDDFSFDVSKHFPGELFSEGQA